MGAGRGVNEVRERVRGDGLADRSLHVGEKGELEVDVLSRPDVAVTAGQPVPLEIVDLLQVQRVLSRCTRTDPVGVRCLSHLPCQTTNAAAAAVLSGATLVMTAGLAGSRTAQASLHRCLQPPEADARLLRDSPRFYAVVVRQDSNKPFGWNIEASDVPQVTVVRMRYQGPLGGIVWQTYELTRDKRWSFRELQRYVLSSVPGAEPIVT